MTPGTIGPSTREALAVEHFGRAVGLAARWARKYPHLDRDELAGQSLLGLARACLRYRADDGPFWPFARACAVSEMAQVARRWRRKLRRLEPLVVEPATVDPEPHEGVPADVLAALEGQPRAGREAVRLRLGLDGGAPDGLNFGEVGRALKVHPRLAAGLYQRAIAGMRRSIERDRRRAAS